jgi:hypothetical protein
MSVDYRLKADFGTKSIASETCRQQTRFTIIYRDLQSLISSRSQGSPVFIARLSSFPSAKRAVARVHERSESRLAEMDSGGENHSRVYRVRDDHAATSAARSRPRVISAKLSRAIDRPVVRGGTQHKYRYRTGSEPC